MPWRVAAVQQPPVHADVVADQDVPVDAARKLRFDLGRGGQGGVGQAG
jgi:hypothetical protein